MNYCLKKKSIISVRQLVCVLVCFFVSFEICAQTFSSEARHKIKVYNEGISSLEERLQMIERARSSIDVEYFLYDSDDVSARIMTQALAKRAREGVKVRVLVDHLVIVLELDKYVAHELKKHGVEVKYFNTYGLFLPIAQHRNHRKHMIVDRNEVMTGGRNIEDKYFDLDKEYNFLDRDVWVRGPIVNHIQNSFDELWNDALTRDPKTPRRPIRSSLGPRHSGNRVRHAQLKKKYEANTLSAQNMLNTNQNDLRVRRVIGQYAKKQNIGVFEGPVTYVTDRSVGRFALRGIKNKHEKHIWHGIKKVLDETRKSVLIESPYLVMSDYGFNELFELRNRNIKVEALTNSPFSTDSNITATFFYSIAKKIAQTGAQVHCYDGGPLDAYISNVPAFANKARWGIHSKTMVLDNKNTAIGTFNLDPRSKDYNIESVLYFPDNRELADYVAQDIRLRMKQSYSFFEQDPITGEIIQNRLDCEGMNAFDCFMFRVQRPLGRVFRGLL